MNKSVKLQFKLSFQINLSLNLLYYPGAYRDSLLFSEGRK